MQTCHCRGAIDDGRARAGADGTHVMYLAFLDYYTQTQYERERWLYDYLCCPTNWLTVAWQRSPYYHVQVMFWSHERKCSVTYSVDATRSLVFRTDMKAFAKHGWSFWRLNVTQRQEIAAARFLEAQLGKPFNRGAYSIFCFGTARPGAAPSAARTEWFCAELVVATLQAIGYLRDVDASSITPGLLYELVAASAAELRATLDATHVVRHQRFWSAIRAGASMAKH